MIHLSPQGKPLEQATVRELSTRAGAILLCGRYEAIDQRFLDAHVDEEISIGDFVVSGGELPALLLVDAIMRLVPGTLNDPESARQESFADGLLDCPHYTRPERLDGVGVPPVLRARDATDAAIAAWRRDAGQTSIASVVPPAAVRQPSRHRAGGAGKHWWRSQIGARAEGQ